MEAPVFAIATLVLAAFLAPIAVIDARRMIIPDSLNLTLALTGLGFQATLSPNSLMFSIISAAGVFLGLRCLRSVHARLTGRIGLGLGDVKMLAAAACWIDPLLLPLLLFIASFAALLFAGGRIALAGWDNAHQRIPFGPFIALGLSGTWAMQQLLFSTAGQP